ncbi:MAG: hypothetical protein IIX84_05990, partial [Oscillospiraceae bacterium]|nr:hypothetical protein [Oscillospiraceae bacterium]
QEEKSLYDSREVLRENAGLFSVIADRAPRLSNCGIYCSDTFVTGRRMMEINLPVTGDRKAACAFFLVGDAVETYSDEELKEILSGTVILDTKAFELVEKRGFGALCGVKSGARYDNAIIEEHTGSFFNGALAGFRRNAWVRFSGVDPNVCVLEPTDEKTEVLSELENLMCHKLGACMTYFENNLGGKVVVCTYLFPNSIQFEAKRLQWSNLMDHAISGGLPVKIEAQHKITPVMRKNGRGECLLMLTNMTYDSVSCFSAVVDAENLKAVSANGEFMPVESEKLAGGKTRIWIEELAPWESIVLVNF